MSGRLLLRVSSVLCKSMGMLIIYEPPESRFFEIRISINGSVQFSLITVVQNAKPSHPAIVNEFLDLFSEHCSLSRYSDSEFRRLKLIRAVGKVFGRFEGDNSLSVPFSLITIDHQSISTAASKRIINSICDVHANQSIGNQPHRLCSANANE